MKRLLASAAVAALMGTAAYAEAHADLSMGYGATEGDFFATNLIGSRLYATEMEVSADSNVADLNGEWNDIGEINDFIVSAEGDVTAVIVGVGGFLGIGEKDVVVGMDMITTMNDDDGNRFLVINASQEELEAAPEFDYDELDMDIADPEEQQGTGGENEESQGESLEAEVEGEAAELTDATEEAAANVEAEAETMEAEAEAEMAEADAEMTEEANEEMAAADPDATEEELAEEVAETQVLEPGVAPEGFALVPVEELTSEELTGVEVIANDDEWVGEVSELLLNDDGQITQAVIDVGGFLGIGEKPVALDFDMLDIMREEGSGNLQVTVKASREELDAMPQYEN